MTKINLTLKVPKANFLAIKRGKHLMIHQGGRGSRKTYGNLETLLYLMARDRDKNMLISVVSETMPHIRRGAMRDFENLLTIYNLWPAVEQNKTESKYKLFGNTIEFFSADSPDKVRGPRRDHLFLNEVNNIPFEAFDQLRGRTAGLTFCDFNPVSEFYIHERIIPNPEAFNYEFTVSTYLDNPFLPDGERRDIEAKKEMAKTNDYWANWWRIYGEGQLGMAQGVVFTNWKQVDAMPADADKVTFGMDFGYSNDPSTLVKVAIKGDDLYVDELFYQTGLLNRDIARMMERHVSKNYDEVFADSAEPKSIHELYQYGYNVKPSEKGKDSVNAGIDKLQSYNIYVTKRSTNLIKELRNYTWVTDKQGKATNKPIDAFNHCIDAIRYAVFRRETATDPEKLKGVFF